MLLWLETVVKQLQLLLCLCFADNMSPKFVLQAGPDRDAANLLAALTEQHVLLFDVRRPAQPLLQWPHGLSAARPQLLSLFYRPTLGREVRSPGAGSMSSAPYWTACCCDRWSGSTCAT